MVVASHASAAGQHLVPGLSLEGIGKHGVFLFFVLSAFLLTRQALTWPWTAAWPQALWSYAVRRVARIAPLYGCVLFAAWTLGGQGLGVPLDGPALLRHALLLEGRGIYWSVPVEFLYYLWIPPLAWWLTRSIPLPVRLLGMGVLLGLCLWGFPAATAPANSDQLRWYLPVFLCGTMAAWWAAHLPLAHAWWGFDALLVALLVLSIPAVAGLPADAWHREFLVWGLLWSAVVVAVPNGRFTILQTLLSSRAMVALGQWCFGLYLLHLPALAVARRLPVPTELQAWVALALSVALAALAHRFIERPAMRFGSRFLTTPSTSV